MRISVLTLHYTHILVELSFNCLGIPLFFVSREEPSLPPFSM